MNSYTRSTDEKYQGWTNYQTWNVALWMGNDEGLYRTGMEFVEDAKQNHDAPVRQAVADAIRKLVTEIAPQGFEKLNGGGIGSRYALESVNWLEVADSFLEA